MKYYYAYKNNYTTFAFKIKINMENLVRKSIDVSALDITVYQFIAIREGKSVKKLLEDTIKNYAATEQRKFPKEFEDFMSSKKSRKGK